MTMKNTVTLFLAQSLIAILVFLTASFFINRSFLKDPKAMSYLSMNEDINKLSKSSVVALDSLIKNNELTFDPSNGNEIDKVLLHLKKTDKKKILIIGSSQMIVISGTKDQLDNNKRFNSKLEYLTDEKYQTYNLSMGAMTIGEKLIVADKAISILNPEHVIIAMTPWDSVNETIRESILSINPKSYSAHTTTSPKDDNSIENFNFPIPINDKLTLSVKDFTKNNLPLYGRRTILQQWLKLKTTSLFGQGIQDMDPHTDNEDFDSPEYWSTKLQELTDVSGWDSIDVKSGKKSLKIINPDGNDALWYGDPIYLDKATKEFEFAAASKAVNVTQVPSLYCLYLGVTFEDGVEQQFFNNLNFNPAIKDWQSVTSKITFDKNVVAVRPFLLFYGGKGTVLFDDISIIPYYNGIKNKNIAYNPGAEMQTTERKHVSYLYPQNDWEKISKNANAFVDYLAEKERNNKIKPAILITPFWYNDNKKAYPQNLEYEKFIKEVRKSCKQKNVKFIDASYILSKDNFSPYKEGDDKGKIDVLHFDENGHNKLAQFLFDELNL